MMVKNTLLSCDWGSSSFRIKLVSLEDQRVIHAFESDQGVATVAVRSSGDVHRQALLLDVLASAVSNIAGQLGNWVSSIPIVASGMISSSLGLVELPYAPMPFRLNANSLIRSEYADESLKNPLLLISGISNWQDVIRGEETQLLAIHRELAGLTNYVCIMPGTHSKHVLINKGEVMDFRTFMTGEFFAVLSQYSVLRDAVMGASPTLTETSERMSMDDFLKGVADSGNHPLLHGLFHVRTKRLFGNMDAMGCSAYLSGLLIGDEIRQLADWHVGKNSPWVISGRGALNEKYRTAIDWIYRDGTGNCDVITIDDCTAQAHCYIYSEITK